MENAEEIFQALDDFAKRKPKVIPRELEEYLAQVARTGDPVYQWPLVRCLFKEKLLNVITDFHETSPGLDIPPCPNVDPFNYDAMKNGLLERLESFSSAPFTVQRICELLTAPRKQYNRIDKFMRAIEKNVLVVSTREPGATRHVEQENGDQADPILNGSDNTSDYSVDVEMEDMSWKDNLATVTTHQVPHPQPGSSDGHVSVDDIQARLQAKEEMPPETENKSTKLYESVTPPEINISTNETKPPNTENVVSQAKDTPMEEDKSKTEPVLETPASAVKLAKEEDKTEPVATTSMVIPEIRIHDVEMTQQIISKEVDEGSGDKVTERTEEAVTVPIEDVAETSEKSSSNDVTPVTKEDILETVTDSDSNEAKHIAEVVTSSEESSSSSDNTDGNSNSPKTDIESHIGIQEELSQPDTTEEQKSPKDDIPKVSLVIEKPDIAVDDNATQITLKSDDYTITDVKSELTQPTPVPEETKEQADSTKTEEVDNKEIDITEIPLPKEEEQVKEDIKEADSTVE